MIDPVINLVCLMQKKRWALSDWQTASLFIEGLNWAVISSEHLIVSVVSDAARCLRCRGAGLRGLMHLRELRHYGSHACVPEASDSSLISAILLGYSGG